ncbi:MULTISPECIES: cyanate transporter [unclassified Caballeronia]|uniref:cyanate transporter n=1 Tax=unclassified Caballeronia TaxID=2646786 RepID=UPI00285C1A93|nr:MULTISPECIES: cyanate transporter [unclassified Caballeronia]MDR5772052.1 cyanate transporter [Caballeronia sp. LZ002]MDR5847486.1 cyanate transporter [Caballeronia sp. LZ003]
MKARASNLVWLAVIVAIGLNLRPLLTSISPLMNVILPATGLSFRGASLLTGLPVVAMGVCAFGASALTRAIGNARGVAIGLVAIVAAGAARVFAGEAAALIASAAVAGTGVAVIQALLPGVMKTRFAARLPFAMGLYSASIMAGGGLGASITPNVAALASWQTGLAVWAIPALIALALWLLLMRADALPRPAVTRDTTSKPSLFSNRRAWALGVFFGLVNGGYTSLVAWLPAYYQQLGQSVRESGTLLALLTVFQASSALLLPMAAARFGRARDRRAWIAAGLAAQLAGFGLLLYAPLALPVMVVALLGAGLGGVFSLTLVLTLDHADDPELAARLVAFVQGVGFVIAAAAPVIAGIVRDASGGFAMSWAMLAASLIAMIALNAVFGPLSYARAMQRQRADFNAPRGTRSIRRADPSSATRGTGGGNARRSPLP